MQLTLCLIDVNLFPQTTCRFPVSDGIAGYVARTGEVVLCTSAGDESRFNSQVDLITGYRTHTILCAPLKTKERFNIIY